MAHGICVRPQAHASPSGKEKSYVMVTVVVLSLSRTLFSLCLGPSLPPNQLPTRFFNVWFFNVEPWLQSSGSRQGPLRCSQPSRFPPLHIICPPPKLVDGFFFAPSPVTLFGQPLRTICEPICHFPQKHAPSSIVSMPMLIVSWWSPPCPPTTAVYQPPRGRGLQVNNHPPSRGCR